MSDDRPPQEQPARHVAGEREWTEIGRRCSAGRRSLWVRLVYTAEELARGAEREADLVARGAGPGCGYLVSDPENVERIEWCAGREGDDAYQAIDRSSPAFAGMLAIATTAMYAAET